MGANGYDLIAIGYSCCHFATGRNANDHANVQQRQRIRQIGNLILADSRTVHMTNCSWDPTAECDHPSWMVWRKNLTAKGGPRTALLLMNNDDVSQASFSYQLEQKHTTRCCFFRVTSVDNNHPYFILLIQDVSIDWTTAGIACPATGCDVRDLDAHADLGAFKDKFHAVSQRHSKRTPDDVLH